MTKYYICFFICLTMSVKLKAFCFLPLQLRCKNSSNLGLKASYYTNFKRFLSFRFQQSLFYYLKNISQIFQTFLYVQASAENMVLVLRDKFQLFYMTASSMHSKTLLWLLILFLNITIKMFCDRIIWAKYVILLIDTSEDVKQVCASISHLK